MKTQRESAITMRIQKRKLGFISGICLAILLFVCIVSLSLFSLGSVLSNNGNRASEKVQANQMAEAGVNALAQQIFAGFDSNPTSPTWPTSISSTTLSSAIGGTTRNDGTYSAFVVNTPTPVGTSTIVYTFIIEGDGTSPDGKVTSKIRSTVTESSASGSGSTFPFPTGGVVTNGAVNVNNGAVINSTTGVGDPGIMANGLINIEWCTVAGPIEDASSNLAASIAATHMSSSQSIVAMAAPLVLPSATQVTTWTAAWLASSKEATSTAPGGNILTTANYNNGQYNNNTITAPAYYSGDLDMSNGNTLTLNQNTTAKAPYVLYVHGNINLGGGTFNNNGVLIVCDGTITIGNGQTYNNNNETASAVISLSSNLTQAIVLQGGSGPNGGLFYAPNGGVTSSNNAPINGEIVSGAANGTVTCIGSGGVHSQHGMAGNVVLGGSSTVYSSGSANTYFPTL